MHADVMSLFRELADRSAAEREACYAQRQTPAAVRAEVESLLRFDGLSGAGPSGYVAASAEGALFGEDGELCTRMTLAPGLHVGSFEVTSLLGVGGMGEVYRARDTVLHRDVALKVLPREVALSPDRAARFEREARTLAALNHPHIAQIYSLATGHDVRALVMELVEGETLAERIARSPIPIDEALIIARQITEALDAAHELGIVHRDLKPGNVKVTADGTVKVLDFGLAKALHPGTDGAAPASISITGGSHIIAGTPAYMSPEQARGAKVDKRADIWAFGCVLYEMSAGRRVFSGEDGSDVIAAVLRQEPDFSLLPATTPRRITQLLSRCLTKDPKQRLRDIGDARLEIDEVLDGPAVERDALASTHRPPDWRWLALAIVGSAAIAGTSVWVAVRPAQRSSPVSRLTIASPAPALGSAGGRTLALSRDGSRLVYLSAGGFVVRERDRLEVTTLRDLGTFPADPFFSPDGTWIGYSDGQTLKRVPIGGGAPIAVAEIGPGAVATWSDDGITVADIRGLFRLPDTGGALEALEMPKLDPAEQAAYPETLPNGRGVLFTVLPNRSIYPGWSGDAPGVRIEALDLRTGVRKTIIRGGSRARYIATGHLVYVAGETVHAVKFDVDQLAVSGIPVPIAEAGAGEFAVSDEGTLVHMSTGGPAGRSLVWVDRSGRESNLDAPPRRYLYPRLSPDGTRVALDVVGPPDRDIWMWDLRRKTLERFTVDPTANSLVAWTRDGRRVAFGSDRFGATSLFWLSADGTGEAERLLENSRIQQPLSFAPDGRLIFSQDVPRRRRDIYALSLDATRTVSPLIESPADDLTAEVSPDGRWIAYDSNESGRFEVYVRPYPDTRSGRRWQISANGGRQPLWSHDGRELFYRDFAGAVMAVSVTLTPAFTPGSAVKALADANYLGGGSGGGGRTYDVAKDGRLLMIKGGQATDRGAPFLVVVQNWFEELKRFDGLR